MFNKNGSLTIYGEHNQQIHFLKGTNPNHSSY